jgi:hypothetical protein
MWGCLDVRMLGCEKVRIEGLKIEVLGRGARIELRE